MPLWVLEPRTTEKEKVPGTVHIERETEEQRASTAHLKHGGPGEEQIVLVPQPSDALDDPLNWSPAKKRFHIWFLAAGSGMASGTTLFLNPSQSTMAKEIGTSVTMLSRSSAVLILCMGVGSVLSSPLARMYGKRPVFIILNAIGVIGYGIILARPKSVPAIFMGRALYGVAVSGLEYLVSSTVGDLFFVHQRGFYLALWHFAMAGGNALGQVIASQIVHAQNYVWALRYVVILMGTYLILTFLFVPETTYLRAMKYDTDVREILAGEEDSVRSDEPTQTEKAPENIDIAERGSDPVAKKKTYWQELIVYSGRFSQESYVEALTKPWITYLLPGVAWASYSYGCSVAFASAFSVSISQIFGAAPYYFTTSAIGLTVLSAFIGTVLGNTIPGPTADWIVRYMSRQNNGVYEPEFRNILCIPSLILGLVGFWGFGLSIEAGKPWIVPVFFFGLATFAGSIMSLVSNTYLLVCHRKHAQDGYAAVTLVKGIMTFAISFFINEWIAKNGPVQVFFVLGLIHGVGCAWGLVLYVFGKRLRWWVHKNRFLQAHLREFDI